MDHGFELLPDMPGKAVQTTSEHASHFYTEISKFMFNIHPVLNKMYLLI